jgi:hypothetical protein
MTDETTRSDDIVVTPDAPQQHGAPGSVPKSEAQLSVTATAFSAKAKDLGALRDRSGPSYSPPDHPDNC